MGAAEVLLVALAIIAAIVVGVFLIVYLIVPIFKAIGWIIAQIFRFIVGEISDIFRFVGAVLLAVLYVPVVLANLVIGRWSATGHYGRALLNEVRTGGLCLYRVAIGHPLRLIKAEGLVEGFEHRLPAVMANAPTSDVPAGGRAGQFDGYQIVGSLAPGGSGAKLYIAVPDAGKKALFARQGFGDPGQVVIKCFSTKEGSSLPQIVRESRSLDAAKRLGLILDHELTPDRFHYVMRYVPGEPLGMVTKNLHAGSPQGGLGDAQLRAALGYAADLVSTLAAYHRGGLWHKDVKPDNIIIDGQGRAHLVDFGLVTSLRSAMTLTTHGTEYFRDPEMVRLALRGVKVHEVDGTRFDIYGAGAVVYALVEDNFPAHGVLSQVTRRCPEAVKWIIRRAMTDYDKRYPSAEAMLADLETVRNAADPFAVRPADLPSMQTEFRAVSGDDEGVSRAGAPVAPPPLAAAAVGAAAGVAGPAASPPPLRRGAPAIRVTNWWSGRSESNGVPAPGAFSPVGVVARVDAPQAGEGPRASARDRAQAARERAKSRVYGVVADRHGLRTNFPRLGASSHGNGWNGGVVVAAVIFLGVLIGIGTKTFVSPPEVIEDGSIVAVEDVPGDVAGEVRDAMDEARAELAQARDGIGVSASNRAQARADRAARRLSKTAGTPVPPEPNLPEAEGTVLIVNDLLPPWNDTAAAYLRELGENIRRTGLDPVGNVPPTNDDPAPVVSQEQRDLIAAARLTLGQRPLDSEEARAQLAAFLDAHEADAIVWIAANPEKKSDRPRAYVVVGHERDDSADAAARRAALEASVARAGARVPEPPAPPSANR